MEGKDTEDTGDRGDMILLPLSCASTCVLCVQVLIYDRFGQDIISPLLSVKELRDMGITLHL